MKNIKRSRGFAVAIVFALLSVSLVPFIRSQNRTRQTRGTTQPQRVGDRTATPLEEQTAKRNPSTEVVIPEPQGKIAFASDRDGDFEIYIMDPDGGGLFRVTDNPADDTQPTWSADGTRLAFVSDRDGNKEIYAVNADGSNLTRLTTNPADDFDPAWSPSFTIPRIAFVSGRTGDDEVFLMNTDGTGQTNLTNNLADDINPAFLAGTGTLIAFATNRDGDKFEIYRMNADGTSQTRLTNNGFNDLAPTWPPGFISFQTDRDTNDEIYTMSATGANPTRVTNNTAFDIDPARSSDGARLVFVSNRNDAVNLEIYSANADGSNVVRLTNEAGSDIDPSIQPLLGATALGTIQFSALNVSVNEGAGGVSITVTRTGGTDTAFVTFETVSGSASDRNDFTPVFRQLTFAAGEVSKSINIPIIDDARLEGDETFIVTLSSPLNAVLGTPNNSTVTIVENETGPSNANPIDTSAFFVRQQYLDFLNREPDAPGLAFWINQLDGLIAQCPATEPARAACVLGARAQISTAFFLSIEFQETGYLVLRLYTEAFGRRPTFREFLADLQVVNQGVIIGQPGAFEILNANRQAFLDDFIMRPEFLSHFAGVTNTAFVNALFANAGVDPNAEAATRDALIAGLNNGTETRQSVLVKVSNTRSVFNALYNPSLVLMEYFAYLRRNPNEPPDVDFSGFNFWLAKLNSFSLPGEDVRDPEVALARIRRAQMVEAFISSLEYRARFGAP